MGAQDRLPRFGGYYRDEPPAEDAELTHVGRRTPCGEYLRRFWQPIALSSELADVPLRIRIMGEDMVLFRDGGGRIGLLELHCSHRGTSLEYGLVTDRGIRCCYHGWLYDIDGTILETPGEPASSRIKEHVVHGAYPARDQGGLIFAYMGPPEEQPPFPIFDAAAVPGNRTVPYLLPFECNWLQVHENGMDPLHSVFLHTRSSRQQFTGAFGVLPVTTYTETRLGLVSTAVRRCDDHVWIRTNDSIMPNICQFGPPWEDGTSERIFAPPAITRWIVPIDDTNCMTIGWRHFNDRVDPLGKGREDIIGRGTVDFMGQQPDRPYLARQHEPGDYDAQTSQGRVALHGREHLGASDTGIAILRRLLRSGIRAVAARKPTPHCRANADGIIATMAHDTVIRAPMSNVDDTAMLARLGAAIEGIVAASLDMPQAERVEHVSRRIRDEVTR